MNRLQRRQLKLAAIAVAVALTVVYTLYHSNRAVTWHVPLSPNSIVPDPTKANASKTKPTFIVPLQTKLSSISPSAIADATLSEYEAIAPTPSVSPSPPPKECIGYEQLQYLKQEPLSSGKRKFPYSRPSPECRTFNLPSLEALLGRMKDVIKDPDLYRLFENSYPNTLDTCIKWRGYADSIDTETGVSSPTDEELAFVITGDINAMWLRDSASQIYSYLPLLESSSDPDSLASLWRGMINSHSRYIIISPYCHSFQPPPESNVTPTYNAAYSQNRPIPPYDPAKVFDCKWELDSLASFLQLSAAYYERTGDLKFFQKYTWIDGVQAAVEAAGAMRLGTYSNEGKVQKSAFTFVGWTNRGSETLTNDGLGNPTKENGMVRTAFRPSDDACIYQLLVSANMMWAKYLEDASLIMEKLEGVQAKKLTIEMREQALGIRKGIEKDAVVHHKEFGDIFAYEIDGYGGANLMDDANIPSLLAMPLWNWTIPTPQFPKGYSEIYMNTRNFILSDYNPYFMRGPGLSAVGGPHLGPGKGWPMAAIVRAITAFSLGEGKEPQKTKEEIEDEIKEQIRMVLDSTDGMGVIHESVNAWNEKDWSRSWFGWANGLMGELILKLEKEDTGILEGSWQ